MTEQQIKRFWGKVAKAGPDECWEWTGCRFNTGYGMVSLGGKLKLASRVAWELENGPIPERKWVLHKCDNRPCCNPAHLFVGTPADNVHDMIAKDRQHYPKGDEHYTRRDPEKRPRGSRNGQAKLTEEQVTEMRALYATGEATQKQLAVRYGVTRSRISTIVTGRDWTHLPTVERAAVLKPSGAKRAVLNADAVRAMRQRLRDGATRNQVAEEFGVTYACVLAISHNKVWKDVT